MWNGTVFIDLDWPLNASNLLSASAELLVNRITTVTTVIYSLGHELCAPFLQCLGQRSYHFHKGRFLLTPMKNNSVIVSPLKKKCFWEGKKGRFDHWANRPQRTPTTKNMFLGALSGNLQCKLWTRWSDQKMKRKQARVQLHPYAHPPCIFGGHHILRVRSEGEVIKLENFRWIGLWVLKCQVGRKWPSSMDLTLWWFLLESS